MIVNFSKCFFAFSVIDIIKVALFKVNKSNIKDNLEKNPIIATKLNEVIGYDQSAAIVKEAYKTNRSIIEIALEKTELSKSQLLKILDPKKLI